MSAAILHDFYNGNIKPHEFREWFIQEHNDRRKAIERKEEEFCGGLTPEQKRAYIALIDEYAALLPCEAEEVYIQGMRMGAQLTMELLAKKDRPILP